MADATVSVDVELDPQVAKNRKKIEALKKSVDTSLKLSVEANDKLATARLARLKIELAKLDSQHTSVDVDVDAAAAEAKLLAIEATVDRLDRQRANVDVDVDRDGRAQQALASILGNTAKTTAALVTFGSVAPAAFGAAAAGAVSLAASSVAAAAGVGAMVAAVVPAFMNIAEAVKAKEAADKAAMGTFFTSTKQQATAAYQAARAAQAVADAEEASARRTADALRRVQDAQEALTEARRDAARALEDLRELSGDQARSEERAEIDLARARQHLLDVNDDVLASDLDRREAALEVREAEDRLSDVQRDRRRTAAELADANRRGVGGSDRVTEATERLREAQEALAEAQADGARAVADAQAAQAQQAEMANLQMDAGTASTRNLAYALGELTPLQRQAYDGFNHLRDSFEGWAESLEPVTIPLFLTGMSLIEQMLPRLTPLVEASAEAFANLLADAGAALQGPFWQDFIDFVSTEAGPVIEDLGHIVGDLATGLAAILMTSPRLTDNIRDMTSRFSDWATSAEGQEQIAEFWERVREAIAGLKEDFAPIWAQMKTVFRSPEFRQFVDAWLQFKERVWDDLLDVLEIFLRDVAPPLLTFLADALKVFVWIDDHSGGVVGFFTVLAIVLAKFGGLGVAVRILETISGIIGSFVAALGPLIPLLQLTLTILGAVALGFIFLKDHMDEAWHFIRDRVLVPMKESFVDAWHTIQSEFIGPFKRGFQALPDVLRNIWTAIKSGASAAWTGIINTIIRAVNAAIRVINAIGDGIEWVAGKIGLEIEIPDIPTLKHVKGFAAGTADLAKTGPFITNGPRAIVGEGNPRHPEFVIPTDPRFRGRALDLFAQLGSLLMAGGGRVPQMQAGGILDPVGKILDAARGIGNLGDKLFGWPRMLLTWFKDEVVGWAKDQIVNVFRSVVVGTIDPAALGIGGNAAANRKLGQKLNAARGWAQFWPALDALVMSESGWNNFAQNPTSTAYGIGQFLDSTWATVGYSKTGDPRLQILAMLDYIAQRYRNPSRAWAFKQAHNWYAAGGILPGFARGLYRVPTENFPAMLHRREMVLPSDAADAARAALEGRGGRAGTVINFEPGAVVINVPPGADGARAGREAAQAFRKTLQERKIIADSRIT